MMIRAFSLLATLVAVMLALALVAPRCLAMPDAAPTAAAGDDAAAADDGAIRQVLMLQSLARGNVVLDSFSREFRAGLEQRSPHRVNVVQVVVGPTGNVGAPDRALVDYLRSMYRDRPPPDLIVAAGGPAAMFARTYRQALFPGTPLLMGSIDEQYLRGAPLGDGETAVPVSNDFAALVDDVLHVLPRTRQIFVVIGSGPLADFWRGRLEAQFRRFGDRVEFVWLDDPADIHRIRSGAALPPDSAILYIVGGTDPYGAYDDVQVFGGLGARAQAPLFAGFTPLFGHGIVGGSMMPVEDIAHAAADVAVRILEGEPAGSLRFAPRTADPPVFDARELRRWDIPESRLPPGSTVQFRAPGLWDQYGRVIVATAIVLVLQTLLIVWLLYERRARHRAESDSRRSLTMAADANRRETLATLATSIGHELGQPLGAILTNARALRMELDADPSAPDATAEILAEIHAEAVHATQIIERHRAMLRSHQMDVQPVDLRSVIDESLALVANEMKTRRIELVRSMPSAPCVIDGDPVLLKQVLVNLFRNAAEALTATPPAQRRITIAMVAAADEAELSVSDTGPGLPAEIADTLFNPFVTTKPMGLGIGLAISQRLIHAHRGTIVARTNADGGATFAITLPRSATATPAADVAATHGETT